MRFRKYGGKFIVYGGKALYNGSNKSTEIIKKIQEEVSLNRYERLNAHFSVGSEINEGIWELNKAYYGLLGRTASTHKWNWMDMVNSDAAFRLTYTSVSHDVMGIKTDAQGGFADTKLGVNITNFPDMSMTLSVYTNDNIIGAYTFVDIGARGDGLIDAMICTRTPGSPSRMTTTLMTDAGVSQQSIIIEDARGFSLSTRVSASDLKLYKNNVLVANDTTTRTKVYPNQNVLLLNLGGIGSFGSARRISVASIGLGLTVTQSLIKSRIGIFSQGMRQYF